MSYAITEVKKAIDNLRKDQEVYRHASRDLVGSGVGWAQLQNREVDLIQELHKLEKDPPMGPGVVMLLTDVIREHNAEIRASRAVIDKAVECMVSTNQKRSTLSKVVPYVVMFVLVSLQAATLFLK